MAESTNSAPAPISSITDLEDPILRARSAAKVVEMVMTEILASLHPQSAPSGCRALLIDNEEFEAASFSIFQLQDLLRDLHEKWETAWRREVGA